MFLEGEGFLRPAPLKLCRSQSNPAALSASLSLRLAPQQGWGSRSPHSVPAVRSLQGAGTGGPFCLFLRGQLWVGAWNWLPSSW